MPIPRHLNQPSSGSACLAPTHGSFSNFPHSFAILIRTNRTSLHPWRRRCARHEYAFYQQEPISRTTYISRSSEPVSRSGCRGPPGFVRTGKQSRWSDLDEQRLLVRKKVVSNQLVCEGEPAIRRLVLVKSLRLTVRPLFHLFGFCIGRRCRLLGRAAAAASAVLPPPTSSLS
jgi:hypothetical protein